MSSSVGSNVFAFLAVLSTSILVLLLLRHFLPLRTTPAYILFPIFLALVLPISIVLLVPIDLASSLRADDEATRGVWLPETVVLVAWRITYWLTFALTWLILPLLGEYIDSGYRTPRDRIVYSLKSNGKYQLIVLICGIAGLVYILLQNGFHTASIKGLVMALAYFWGLIFAIYLMGHGLVAVPRRLLRNAKISHRLRIIQSHAPKIHERLMDAVTSLEELELQVTKLRQRKNGISRDHQDWIEEIADGSNLPEARLTSNTTSTSAIAIPAVITDRYLAGLARKLNRARHKRLRFIDAWDRLVQDAVDTQAVLDASSSRRLDLGQPAPYESLFGRVRFLTPHARYVFYSQVVPAARISLGIVLALASVCIVWSEIVKHVAPKLSIIRFTVVTHRGVEDGKVHFAGQVMASLWILYMCTAALASFGDVKVWGNRALVPRNTYGESATWYSGQIAKLTVPLAYNFLTFLPPTQHQGTMFYKFLGSSINLTPLGKGFDFFFPIFILIPACATLFNLYGRIKSVFSFDFVEDDDENMATSGPGGWREGKALIDSELTAPSRFGLSRRSDRASSPLRSGHESPAGSHRGNGSFSSSHSPLGRISTLDEQQAQRLNAATRAAEEEDENFFQGFAHRVRNTFDTMDRPDWMNDLGKRPKWMGRINGNSEGSGRAESGRGLGRWFGGRPADGRVRL